MFCKFASCPLGGLVLRVALVELDSEEVLGGHANALAGTRHVHVEPLRLAMVLPITDRGRSAK